MFTVLDSMFNIFFKKLRLNIRVTLLGKVKYIFDVIIFQNYSVFSCSTICWKVDLEDSEQLCRFLFLLFFGKSKLSAKDVNLRVLNKLNKVSREESFLTYSLVSHYIKLKNDFGRFAPFV